MVMELAKKERQIHPRMGCRKVLSNIQCKLNEAGISIGRDAFFDLMGANSMHVEKKKRFSKTTYSNHGYAISPNRIKDLEIVRPNQVFVSDITYIRTLSGFAYLFLVTDLHSRNIVGWSVRTDLSHQGAIDALNMAIATLENCKGLIHHTDRGSQYCCHSFLKEFGGKGIAFSNTDDSHVYQNAVAERINGILKDEYNLDSVFTNIEHLRKTLKQAIFAYNNLRPHISLKYNTPGNVYKEAA
jgi:putative transposase